MGSALAALVMIAGAASAPASVGAREAADRADWFAQFDADRDGRVSLAEFQQRMSAAFLAMDADHDGVVEGGEWPNRGRPRLAYAVYLRNLAQTFRRQDVNADGWLNLAELTAPPR